MYDKRLYHVTHVLQGQTSETDRKFRSKAKKNIYNKDITVLVQWLVKTRAFTEEAGCLSLHLQTPQIFPFRYIAIETLSSRDVILIVVRSPSS